jgi:hypothetical protein
MANNYKAIAKRIAYVGTNMDKMNSYIHDTGVLIMEYANANGNPTLALDLAKAMPASMRRTMLIKWFAKYSPIAVKLGDSEGIGFNAKYVNLKKAEAKAAAWDIEGAEAEPFYLMAEKEAEAPKELTYADLVAMFASIGKRIQGKLDENLVAANDVDSAKELIGNVAKFAASAAGAGAIAF